MTITPTVHIDVLTARIADDLLSRTEITSDEVRTSLYPSAWFSGYRDLMLSGGLQNVVRQSIGSWNPATGVSVPEGPPLVVGQYICTYLGRSATDGTTIDFTVFTDGQKTVLGQWWLDNRARYMAWAQEVDSDSESDEADSLMFDDDEPLTPGMIVDLAPGTHTTSNGGNVYWGDVRVAEVVDYGYSPTGPDVRLRAIEGGHPEHMTQSVGRQWLRRRPTESLLTAPEPFIPDVVPLADLEAMRAERDRALADLATARAERDRISVSYAEEAQVVSDIALRVAEENDFCSKYEDFVAEVNRRNSLITLQAREKDYTVSWTEEYTVRITRSEDISTDLTGDDLHDRMHEVANDADTLSERDLIELLRENGSHEYVDESVDNVSWESND